ncbi:MFS transporter [Nocardia sp. CC227C]|uniref:MFS transporter n=1 Tax=Nocardia sp. CC227C TaxID=3044562 RepID=UPI00278C6BB2|nr:MFS transporter [Nocardia sp. CC227C]
MTRSAAQRSSGAAVLAAAGRRRVLIVLCLTEIISWGILYYAFPVLAVPIAESTGWSPAPLSAAFSVGLLVSAIAGIPIGRLLDRSGPRRIMTCGSVLAVPALVVIATAPSLAVFTAGWVLAGVAMGAILYPPAFAALTRWHHPGHVRALMVLTLSGGLASTVFAPLTAVLVDPLGWRGTYLALAALLGISTVPLHWFGLRGPWPRPPTPGELTADAGWDVIRSRRFLTVTTGLALGAFAAFAALFNLVPLLLERGVSPAVASVAFGLGGAAQVLGRIGYLPWAARTGAHGRLVAILAAIAATVAVLGIAQGLAALIAGTIGAGVVRGLLTLVQATAVSDRWGAAEYGRLNGVMQAPIVIVMALAPWAGTALAGWTGSYVNSYFVLAAVALAALVIAGGERPFPVIYSRRTS